MANTDSILDNLHGISALMKAAASASATSADTLHLLELGQSNIDELINAIDVADVTAAAVRLIPWHKYSATNH